MQTFSQWIFRFTNRNIHRKWSIGQKSRRALFTVEYLWKYWKMWKEKTLGELTCIHNNDDSTRRRHQSIKEGGFHHNYDAFGDQWSGVWWSTSPTWWWSAPSWRTSLPPPSPQRSPRLSLSPTCQNHQRLPWWAGGGAGGQTASLRSMFCSEQKSLVMGMQLKYLQISQSWMGVT